MRCNADRLIEALIKSQLTELHSIESTKNRSKQKWEKSKVNVVTISRGYGTMGNKIAQLLADVLELRCCDCFILQEVARRANVDEELVKILDEHVSIVDKRIRHIDEHWWKTLINKYSFTHEDYHEYLVKTVLSISLHGGVIIGRGANLILGPDKAFRIRLVGTPEKCAERIAKREDIDFDEAMQKIHDIDHERAEYLKKVYHSDIDNPLSYDLVINTDRYSHTQTVELILEAMQKADYKLPVDAFESINVMA